MSRVTSALAGRALSDRLSNASRRTRNIGRSAPGAEVVGVQQGQDVIGGDVIGMRIT